MVLAGAGSGKTRVLTYRIAYMLAHGVNPYRILALTFTNKAAAEMRARIISLVGGDMAKAVTMGTFHSVFYRILRAEADKLGFTHNLTVYDTDDSKSLIKSIVKEMNLDPKVYAPNHILNRISMAKSNLLSAQEYADNHDITTQDAAAGKPHIAQIFARYNARLRNADAMDFDDLLYFMNVLLRDFPDMLYKYQNRYNYILVDEYQDTNFAQYLIVKKLAAAHQNLCVVGDDAQSIYGFRGADIQNILNFRRDFPLARIYKLEQNYRSTQNIVNAANAIIKNNKDQMPKEVWTSNEKGARIQLIHSNSDTDEAVTVANAIFETKMNEHADNRQFAILYRTNIQSRTLEEALVKRNIPYKIYGGLSFYKRKEIKDLLAYFRLTVNHYDEESLRRVINYPMRGIGDTTVARIATAAQENNVHFWDVVCDPAQYNLSLGATANKVVEFADMIKGFTAQLRTTDAYELGKHIVHLFTESDLRYSAKSGRYNLIQRIAMMTMSLAHLSPWMYFPSNDKLSMDGRIRKGNKILHEWVDYYLEHVADDNEFVRIGYGGAKAQERAERLVELLESRTDLSRDRIQLAYVSPIVGAHTGDTVLSFFFKQRDER